MLTDSHKKMYLFYFITYIKINHSGWNNAVPRGQTDRHKLVTKLSISFRQLFRENAKRPAYFAASWTSASCQTFGQSIDRTSGITSCLYLL